MATGVITASFFTLQAELLSLIKLLILMLIFLSVISIYQRAKGSKVLIYILVFLLSFLYLQQLEFNWNNNVLAGVIEKKAILEAKVIKVEERERSCRYLLTDIVFSNDKLSSQQRILLSVWEKSPEFAYGDIIKFKGRLKLPSRQRNPGEFSYREYLKQQRVYGILSLNNHNQIMKIKTERNVIISFLYKIRRYLVEIIESNFSKDHSGILQALLLGRKDSLSDSIEEGFRNLGLSHLLVISGFHVGLISYLLYLVVDRLKLAEQWKLIITISFLIFYLLLTGCQLPSLRAVLLISLVLIANTLNRRVDIYNLLAGVAIILLIINPYHLFTVSFQLSFGAVVAISYLAPIIARYLPFKSEKLKGLLSASLAAQLGLLPILSYYFYQVSYLSIIANLFIMPLITLVLWLGLVFILLNSTHILFLATAFSYLIKFILLFTLKLVALLNNSCNPMLVIGRPSLVAIIVYYIILISIAKLLEPNLIPYSENKIKKTKFIIISLALLLIFQSAFKDDSLEISFLDVGNGDAIYLKLPTGEDILVDVGEEGRVVRDFLLAKGIRQIDLLILSHFHQDHVGALIELMDKFKIKRVAYPQTTGQNILEEEIIKILDKREIDNFRLNTGDILNRSLVSLRVLAPKLPLIEINPENNNSLVIKAIYKELNLLLTGDLEVEGEKRLLEDGLEANIIKVGHHGSNTSTSVNFIKRVKPQLAIISVGDNNYGHPSVAVLDRLKNRGIRVLRTDQGGAIKIITDGQSYSVEEFLN